MSNDADYTPEDDEARQQVAEIGQMMEELIKLLERNCRKVVVLTVEFEDGPQPRFVRCRVEDPVAGADDLRVPDRDKEDLH